MNDQYAGLPGSFVIDPAKGVRVPAEVFEQQKTTLVPDVKPALKPTIPLSEIPLSEDKK